MKKKVLSLIMAAAMVATTSTGVFASNIATGSNNLTGIESTGTQINEYRSDVAITGDVANDLGEIKPGTINVTVPTAASFQVDNKGSLTGATLNVVNDGTQKVEIFVDEFVDTNGENGIKVVPKSETDKAEDQNITRDKVSLNLRGNFGVAYLKSEAQITASNRGVYSDPALAVAETNGHKIAEIQPASKAELVLEGDAGKKATGIQTAIKDGFTLKLMVRKAK